MIEDFISAIFAHVSWAVTLRGRLTGDESRQRSFISNGNWQQRCSEASAAANDTTRFDVEHRSTFCKIAAMAVKQQPVASQGLIPPLSSYGYGCRY